MSKLVVTLTSFLTIYILSVSFSSLDNTEDDDGCEMTIDSSEKVEMSIDSITGDTIYRWFMNVTVARIIDKPFFEKLEKEMEKYVPNSEYLKGGKSFRLEALQMKVPYCLTDSVDFSRRCIISLTPSKIDWEGYYLVKTDKYVYYAHKNLLGVVIEATDVEEELYRPEGINFFYELFNKHLTFFYDHYIGRFQRITVADLSLMGDEYFEFDMKAR